MNKRKNVALRKHRATAKKLRDRKKAERTGTATTGTAPRR
ncbi:MAG: hypothetical protein JWP00_654 [Chloroflexi bacterium]|jgi:hypothetical protein|nr:hypothetical protein [Chloroflexota bacterium]